MSVEHMAMVFNAAGLDGSEKLLLLAYTNYTDAHGYCWPGVPRLAADTGTSVATVKRVRKKLEQKNLLRHQRRTTKKGDADTNMYRVNLDKLRTMARKRQEFDDDLLSFDTEDAPAPAPEDEGQDAPPAPADAPEPDPETTDDQDADQRIAQSEPTPGETNTGGSVQSEPTPAQSEPTSGQIEPTSDQDEPTSGQIDPQSLNQPPAIPSLTPSENKTHHPHQSPADDVPEATAATTVVEGMLKEIHIPTGVRQPGPRSPRWTAVVERCVEILEATSTYGLDLGSLRRHLSVDLVGVRDVLSVWAKRLSDDELPPPKRRGVRPPEWQEHDEHDEPEPTGDAGEPETSGTALASVTDMNARGRSGSRGVNDDLIANLRAAIGMPRGDGYHQRLAAIDSIYPS